MMGHQKLTPTGKKFLGGSLLKPDRPFHDTKTFSRIKETQKQLEILERAALLRRARERGERIREKVRRGDASRD
jgi:hypothetical protein